MDKGKKRQHSHLFTLRVWDEEVSEGEGEWRGKVQHVISGETRSFRDWQTLISLITGMLPSRASPQQPESPGDKDGIDTRHEQHQPK